MTNVEKNRCEMTYMFEYPQYIKQKLPKNVTSRFPQYQLYLYGEGKYAEELREKKVQGIPVLFIPGNAGSHRQVRSFGSVALRMAQTLHSPYRFNFFSIDYNEELSGLFGGVLWNQTVFLKECILYILSLYSKVKLKSGIIIIGHSMGGMLAKALFAIPNFDSSSVSLIFTMATPHKPPVDLDSHISAFYANVNWAWQAKRKTFLKDIPVVAVGGGERDILVRSDLTLQESKLAFDVNVLTTEIPRVWLSTDHLCIVWCKQLVLTVIRSMFDVVDRTFGKDVQDVSLTHNILKHYFGRRTNILPYKETLPFAPIPFAHNSQWILKDEMSWRFIKKKVLSTIYLVVPLVEGEMVILLVSGLERPDWIHACQKLNSNPIECVKGEDISSRGRLLPGDATSMMMTVSAKKLILRGHTHLVVHLAPPLSQAPLKQPSVNVVGERYRPMTRHKTVVLPNLLQSLTTFTPQRLLNVPITEGAVFYNLSLKGLAEVWQVYTFTLETRTCKVAPSGPGIARFVVPWSNEDRYYSIKPLHGAQLRIAGHLYFPQPYVFPQRMAQLHLILPPECSYTLTVQMHLFQLAGQFVKFYGTLVFAYMTALMLVALSSQLRTLSNGGVCLPLLTALANYPTFIILALIPEIICQGLSVAGLQTILPEPDDVELHRRQHHFFLMRTVLYAVAYGLVVILTVSSSAALTLFGMIFMWLRGRCFGPYLFGKNVKGDLSVVVITGSCIFSASGLVFPGAAILLLTMFQLFIRLAYMCGRNRVEEDRRGLSLSSSRWRLHQTMFLLQLLICAVVSPSFLVWAKGLEYSFRLPHDPHLVSAVVIVLSGAALWQMCLPCKTQLRARSVSYVVLLIAIVSTTHCLLSVWRISYLLASVFAIVAAQQIASWGHQVKQD